MPIAIPAPATTTTAPALTATVREAAPAKVRVPRGEPRYPHIPAVAGNANVRALLGQGIHPASGQPLADAPGADCGNCHLAPHPAPRPRR
ncbi:hypothetical protein ACWF9B_08470 [Streptomyces sp. NPDC055089]